MESNDKYEPITITIRRKDLIVIDKAADLDGRNRSSYLAKAGVDRAKELGVDIDA